jgi:hypothetical protein
VACGKIYPQITQITQNNPPQTPKGINKTVAAYFAFAPSGTSSRLCEKSIYAR